MELKGSTEPKWQEGCTFNNYTQGSKKRFIRCFLRSKIEPY